MSRLTNLIIILFILFFIHIGVAQTQNQPLTGQSFSGEITLQASPEEVWNVLTNVSQLTDIMGYEYVGGAKSFARVGSKAQVKVWGDNSGFMVVRADKNRELRFNLDPDNGSYICNCRWVLSKSGNGTKVQFVERYTESGPQTREDLAAQVRETNEQFKRLKVKVEKQ
ncbi:MAG: SRPBCC domain-containing protein [Calditrichaeota bacterium]|nr:MAG: SRPBCC domain-containing protein [Calditrichota bacterium]